MKRHYFTDIELLRMGLFVAGAFNFGVLAFGFAKLLIYRTPLTLSSFGSHPAITFAVLAGLVCGAIATTFDNKIITFTEEIMAKTPPSGQQEVEKS